MSRTVILLPFRPANSHRVTAFNHVLDQALSTGFEVFVGDSQDDPFSLGRTFNALAEEAGEWDNAIFWTADYLLQTTEQIHAALDHPKHFVRLYDTVKRMDEQATLTLDFSRATPSKGYLAIWKLSRQAWEQVGGYDPRFKGHGFEDYPFAHGLSLFGHYKKSVPGLAYGLYHPTPKNDHSIPYYANRDKNKKMWNEISKIKTRRGWREYLEKRA